MLSEDAAKKLSTYPGSASASVMKLTSRVEQLEAEVAATAERLQGEIERLRDEMERFDSDGAPPEKWLLYAFARLKIYDLPTRNKWRRAANLSEEKSKEWDEADSE
jgi:hypothetical protein